MIKYITLAAALKCFSISPQAKWAYRQLGNTLGQRMRLRSGLESFRIDRVRNLLEIFERHHTIKSGDKLLELGTGWIHWESTVIRLFNDVQITLFDVWDNRQLKAYKRFFGLLEQVIDKELCLDAVRSERAHKLLQVIARANSFEEIYSALDFSYVINPSGALTQFQDQSFSLIYSCSVFEHIYREALPTLMKEIQRLLKPGGYSVQIIDLGDHLAYYDRSVCQKNYLRYSDKVWKIFFENDVQYFNRVQAPEWLSFFRGAGLELVEEEMQPMIIDSIKIDNNYASLNKRDLECGVLTAVHQRPDARR
jgi:SAM-dependent methyltransferase